MFCSEFCRVARSKAWNHTAIPRLGLPVRASVFVETAARLRHLAQDNPAAAHPLLMAKLVDARQYVLGRFFASEAPAERLSLTQAHGMPLRAIGRQRDPAWRGMLDAMLDNVVDAGVPEPAVKVCAKLKHPARTDSAALEAMVSLPLEVLMGQEGYLRASGNPLLWQHFES